MSVTVHYVPQKNRRREAAFFAAVMQAHRGSVHLAESCRLDARNLDHVVDARKLTHELRRDALLPMAKRIEAIACIEKLPSRLRVALEPRQVTCDIVVKSDHDTFYVEFHEEQHRRLTVRRQSLIYSEGGETYYVPRFVQRLVRDVWRVEALRNVTVVWCDWFAQCSSGVAPRLSQGFQEFAVAGQFEIGALCNT
jgi:hypothetical protein